MERVVGRDNARAALKRVRQNQGSPGVDGMTVDELPAYLAKAWPRVREELLNGTYQPKPVKQQQIPKRSGGVRELGIPCVLDRFIQQAILQVLQPMFDPGFSEHSYGFRPGRRAHDAVCAAQRYIQQGRRWVVDVDLEKFFDRVNHDVLMGRLARWLKDKRMLRLIRRYLEAGILVDGVVVERLEGTPQGGPLSPLLANLLLDEVDKELEKRGHAFVRYADDCNVYVRSRRAGLRVMETLRRLYARIRLRVNEAKSKVGRPESRSFLGFSFFITRGQVKRRIATKALDAFKERVRRKTRRVGGRSLPRVIEELSEYLIGWKAYFRLTEAPSILETLDMWIRRRLRAIQVKQWRNARHVYEQLRALGAPDRDAREAAAHFRRYWRIAMHPALCKALSNRYFDQQGLARLAG